ncbi:ENV2 protein, partial [Corvus moneduloides]|nr:ENV2 protein [Corvus moneduloides]
LTSPKNRNGDPFWNLMQASYQALNKSRPNLTEDCWLCYSVKPPYYEAIGKTNKVQWSNGTNPRECSWSEQKNYTQGITIQSITGKGKCLG